MSSDSIIITITTNVQRATMALWMVVAIVFLNVISVDIPAQIDIDNTEQLADSEVDSGTEDKENTKEFETELAMVFYESVVWSFSDVQNREAHLNLICNYNSNIPTPPPDFF